MITLKNEKMVCEIAELGAEIRKLTQNGQSLLWSGDSSIWGGVAPLLFPICGGLKENKYIYEGKEYSLPRHGFIRTKTFTVEKQTENSATFMFASDAETLKYYPFNFEIRVTHTLLKNGFKTAYAVKNTDNKDMYFSIGSHEAYLTPEGVEDYDVIFPQKETLNTYILDNDILSKRTMPILKDSNILPIYDKYFMLDAIIFKDLKSKSATLRNRKTGRFVKVDFKGKPYFLIWHKPSAPYLCLEPWAGISDTQGSSYDITEKEGIIKLKAGDTYKAAHSATFGE